MVTKEYFDFIVALEKEKEPNVEFQSRFQKKLLNFLEFQTEFFNGLSPQYRGVFIK